MASQKAQSLRCAAPFVTATYIYVRLTPQDLHALTLNFLLCHTNDSFSRQFYQLLVIKKNLIANAKTMEFAIYVAKIFDLQGPSGSLSLAYT